MIPGRTVVAINPLYLARHPGRAGQRHGRRADLGRGTNLSRRAAYLICLK